ncbi:hypothetical protein UFOVP649_74 [uncultured Caudovirales phage]|uniref:Transmembrane Fragile-X-F protein n=1 Tax=uncultured Caudovirales phage TaxID=2100421 RepID=A0A6J5N9C9_9CAUD|nr:hypothetical protein UFOVP649_74 [uncultured Caudovirales phage]
MSDSSSSSSSGGIGFTGLLTVLFVGLKLTNVIAWPWLWVLSPIWIPLLLLIGFLIIAALFTAFLK